MKRLNRLRWAGVACAGLLALTAMKSQAQFTPISFSAAPGVAVTPGLVSTVTDPELTGGVVLATTGERVIVSGAGPSDYLGDYEAEVYQTNTPGKTLDFEYQVETTSPPSLDTVVELSTSLFNVPGVTLAVGYTTQSALELFAPGTVTPTSAVAPTPGSAINWTVAMTPGSVTDTFIIQTNAVSYVPGFFATENNGTDTVPGFSPVAPTSSSIPESGSLFCGLAVAALGAAQLLRRKSENDEVIGLAA